MTGEMWDIDQIKLVVGLVVSIFFNFHPYLGKSSNLTNNFQMGWNHQLEIGCFGSIRLLLNAPKSKLVHIWSKLNWGFDILPILLGIQFFCMHLDGVCWWCLVAMMMMMMMMMKPHSPYWQTATNPTEQNGWHDGSNTHQKPVNCVVVGPRGKTVFTDAMCNAKNHGVHRISQKKVVILKLLKQRLSRPISILQDNTVDGRHPSPVDINDLPVTYQIWCISGGGGFLPSTVCWTKLP